jgi:hypothetical protein
MNPLTIDLGTVPAMAERLSRAGPFQGATAADLEARILLGAGLGIDPATACSNISFANGRATFTASLQAALLTRAGWSFRIDTLTDEVCELTFHRDGKKAGTARFALDEAKRANLLKRDVWAKYPQDLLFARALTRGVRRLVPGLLAGSAAYTREEAGEDQREPIPVEAKPGARPPAPSAVAAPAVASADNGKATPEQLAELKRLKDALAINTDAWKGIVSKRGVDTARDLTPAQADGLIARLKARLVADQLEEKIAEDDAVTVEVPVTAKGKEDGAAGPTSKSGVAGADEAGGLARGAAPRR